MNVKKTIYEVEEIEDVIDFMRSSKNITSLSETNGITTIVSDTLKLLDEYHEISLQNGQIICINNVNYTVSNVNQTLKQFDITASNLVATEWNLAINYLYGHRIEINEILANAANDSSKKYNRFPLIWLFINNERNHNPIDGIDFNTTLSMAFVGMSEISYKANDRLTNVFKTVLQPLFDLFIHTINSTYFRYMFKFENDLPEFMSVYRYFYGSSDKNLKVLTAPTDAIEANIELSFCNQYNCTF